MRIAARYVPDIGAKAIVLEFMIESSQFVLHLKFIFIPSYETRIHRLISRSPAVRKGTLCGIVDIGCKGFDVLDVETRSRCIV